MDDLNVQAEELSGLFRSIISNFRRYMLNQFSENKFTAPQMMLMHELYHHPEITLKELSNLMGLAKSTVCGIVDRLENQGVVVRSSCLEDRRKVKISLTPKMLEFKDSMNIVKTNYLIGLLKTMELEEIEQILGSLRKLNSLMENSR